MHEETRRRLLQAAFGLLCLFPALGIVAWSFARALPLHTRRWERHLHERLGVEVRIGRISTPRPRMRCLHDVTIVDLESRQALAEFARLDASMTDQGWRWVIPQMSLPQSAISRWWQIIEQRLLRDDSLAEMVSHVTINQLALNHAQRPLVLHNVDWARAPRPDVQRSRLVFQLSDSKVNAEAVQIQLHRDRSGSSPASRLILDTGNLSLPLSLLVTVAGFDWPTAASLRGHLPLVWRKGRWHGQFTGQLSALDLQDLSSTWLPYAVSGTASLKIHRCMFDATGLQSIQGWLSLKRLVAPQHLVQSLIEAKLFSPGPAYVPIKRDETLPVSELGVAFSLNEMGLVCKGIPDEAGLPVASRNDSGVMLLSDAHVRMNRLICALVPEDAKNAYPTRARLTKQLPATLPRF
jgi:hypothetical protein